MIRSAWPGSSPKVLTDLHCLLGKAWQLEADTSSQAKQLLCHIAATLLKLMVNRAALCMQGWTCIRVSSCQDASKGPQGRQHLQQRAWYSNVGVYTPRYRREGGNTFCWHLAVSKWLEGYFQVITGCHLKLRAT